MCIDANIIELDTDSIVGYKIFLLKTSGLYALYQDTGPFYRDKEYTAARATPGFHATLSKGACEYYMDGMKYYTNAILAKVELSGELVMGDDYLTRFRRDAELPEKMYPTMFLHQVRGRKMKILEVY